MLESSGPSIRRNLLAGSVGVLLLALWFGGISWATDAGIRKFERNTVIDPARPADAQPWRAARFFAEPDSYYWLSYARDLLAADAWRMRYTHADNVPVGRETHWAHPLIWGLMGIARLLEAGGALPPLALELAGRILMPLSGWLFFSGLYLVLGHRLGWRLAALVVATMAAVLHWDFHTLRPDHGGFQLAASVFMWLGLLLGGMGWSRRASAPGALGRLPTPASARRWFFVSSLFGGIGLWLGATVHLFSLAATAAGAAAVLVFIPPPAAKEPVEIWPNLWRFWGFSGAIVALVFYAVEYAPHHMGMRLETNHPLYALCWLGTAESLRTIALWRTRGRLAGSAGVSAALGFGAAILLPLLIVFGPVAWFLPRTAIMLRLHAHHIIEFRTLFSYAGAQWPQTFLLSFGVAVPATIWTLLLLRRHQLPTARQLVLIPLCAVATIFTLLYFWQIRWEPFALAAGLLLAGFLLADSRGLAAVFPARSVWRHLPALMLGLFALQLAYGTFRLIAPLRQLLRVEKLDELWLKALLQRNLMLQLKAQFPDTPLRLVLPAEMATAAYYFGVGSSLGSLYWENPAGLVAAGDFFGDPLPGERARQIAVERGLTHVLMNSGAGDALMFYQLATGRSDQLGASRTVGGATARSGAPVPSWLHPMPELDSVANPTYYVLVPKIGQWVPLTLPVSIYRPAP